METANNNNLYVDFRNESDVEAFDKLALKGGDSNSYLMKGFTQMVFNQETGEILAAVVNSDLCYVNSESIHSLTFKKSEFN